MKILALDQSSHITGYSIFDLDSGKLIHSGLFAPPQNHPLPKRLEFIKRTICSLIKEHSIDKVILEDIQLQSSSNSNVITYKTLAEVIGVITETLQELNIPFELVHAASWRSELKIKGTVRKEQKKNAQDYVKLNYNKDVSEDESDAICIGSSFIQKNKSAFNWG